MKERREPPRAFSLGLRPGGGSGRRHRRRLGLSHDARDQPVLRHDQPAGGARSAPPLDSPDRPGPVRPSLHCVRGRAAPGATARRLPPGLVVFGVSTAITGLARDHPLRGASDMGWEGTVHNISARVAIYGILASIAALVPAAASSRPARVPAVVFSAGALVLIAAAGLF
jgi:hypothetical protein